MTSRNSVIEFHTLSTNSQDVSVASCSRRPQALKCRWIATGDPLRPLICEWRVERPLDVGQRIPNEDNLTIYRTSRPLVVDAAQCAEAKTFATDMGFINVKRGEWMICGEGGERYVVDDTFFQRTFVAVDGSSHNSELTDPDRGFTTLQSERNGIHFPQRT